MKKLSIIFSFLLFLSCSNQVNEIKTSSNPELDSIQSLIEIAKGAKELSVNERLDYLKDAETKVFEIDNDTLRLNELSDISLAYKSLKDSSNFRRSNEMLARMSKSSKLYKTLGYSHWDMAAFHKSYGVLDSAMFHYKKALNSFEILPRDSSSLSLKARILYNMGQVQDSYKDYLGAEQSITKAINIFEDLNDNKRLYANYNLMGIISSGMKQFDQSLMYYEKASEYLMYLDAKEKNDAIWINQNNIASTQMRMEQLSLAQTSYQNLLADKNLETNNPNMYAKALISLAYIFFKKDKEYDKAKDLLKKGIEITEAQNDITDLARPYQFYAEILAEQGDSIDAIEYAKKSYTIAKETYNNDRSLNVLKVLTNLDTKNAAKYANEYYSLSESIQVEENTKRDKFARVRLETDQVIEENQVLTEEKQMWAGAVFGLVVFGFAFISIVILYINNNRLKFKQKQQESNQEIYNLMLSQQGKFEEGKQLEQKRISEELHDGILGEMLGIRLILSGLNEREDMASVAQRADLIEKLRGVEEEIRTISHELNSAAYKKFHNFIVSLEDMIGDIEQSSGITCSFTYDNEVSWDNLLGDIKINAYRIVQEALKNCIKHAESQRVTINFQPVGDNLQLTIADDGVGFDVNKGRKGIGLKNIISRTKKVKGTVDIDSKKGTGTTITVTIPARFIELNVMEQTQTANA